MDLMLNTYKVLKEICSCRTKNFSGIGLVAYDEETFSPSCHCDLRPGLKSPAYMVTDGGIVNYLSAISDYHHTLHDGFHMMNNKGTLTHVAQYFVPPLIKNLKPNQEHGVRLYSAICGSTLKGVLFIGVISSDWEIYIFDSGRYVNLTKLEEKIK